MNNFLVICFFITIFIYSEVKCDYCLSKDDNPYMRFSTKTAYDVVRGSAGSETTCKPIQIWILSRHGTRYGDEDDLVEMKTAVELRDKLVSNFEAGLFPNEGALCMNDYTAIKNWNWDESVEDQIEYLNEQGWQDLLNLAQRYSKRYPSILGGPYNPDDYYFRHTLTQRTEMSCKAFIDGLFGNGSHETVRIESPLENDPIIKPYDFCKRWLEDVNNNPDRKEEKKTFRSSDDYKALLADITKRMGFSKTLKHDDIDAMYDNCRYDKTRRIDQLSPWCSIFTKKELYLMEYHEDLGRFYKSGYGHEYHPKLGCMPLKNLLETFEPTVNNNGSVVGPKLVAMFSHDTMLDMMYTAMNYSKDQELLKGTDYEDLLINRRYSTSKNTPFGGNVVAVLHECADITEEQFQIQLFINERPMELTGCSRGLCGWKTFQQTFASAYDCNIDFCDK